MMEDVCTGQNAQFGHETLSCYATLSHLGQPHMAIVCPPCPHCDGFDEHATECPALSLVSLPEDLVSTTARVTLAAVYVRWNDGDERPEIVDWQYWRTWQESYRPRTYGKLEP